MQKKNSITNDDLKLYKDCPRCFYLSYKFGINRPSKTKKVVKDVIEASEEKVKEIKKAVSKGAPLPSPKCPFCIYRHLVKETGVENEITA